MSLYIDPDKRVLFAFSDPGGAKAILTLAHNFGKTTSKYDVISDRIFGFFSDFQNQVSRKVSTELAAYLKESDVDLIITGTSYTSDFENQLIQLAKASKIEVWSFIDHWSKMRERFIYNEKVVFPDRVLVIDDRAKSLAQGSGIPSEIIQIIGHPYQDYISNYQPLSSKDAFLKAFQISDKDLNFLFAPDPLSNVKEANDWIKTDEFEIAELLIRGLEGLNSPQTVNLFVKFHPNQKVDSFIEFLNQLDTNINVIIPNKEYSFNDLIYYCSFTVSMFSNVLKESVILGTPIIRIMTNIDQDPLEGFETKRAIRDQNSFTEQFKNLIAEQI
ncbi:MAG: hypothetical protein MRY83_24140 [Flavobacteriales bacterium]|nr:hypothetical protein [Flavobacteriales bacterium]